MSPDTHTRLTLAIRRATRQQPLPFSSIFHAVQECSPGTMSRRRTSIFITHAMNNGLMESVVGKRFTILYRARRSPPTCPRRSFRMYLPKGRKPCLGLTLRRVTEYHLRGVEAL